MLVENKMMRRFTLPWAAVASTAFASLLSLVVVVMAVVTLFPSHVCAVAHLTVSKPGNYSTVSRTTSAETHTLVTTTQRHPRLFYDAAELPRIRANAQSQPYLSNLLTQYSLALERRLNYSAGGRMQDVYHLTQTPMGLATAIYVADFGINASAWGRYAAQQAAASAASIANSSDGGGWFAGNERALQLAATTYDVTGSLLSPAERAATEAALATSAQRMSVECDPTNMSRPTGCFNAADMASRLMNPSADRLAALGLIALVLPTHPNASGWLAHTVAEVRWILRNGVMADGQWHEPATRYHGRVLSALVPLAYALRHAGVADLFMAPSPLKRFVGWYRYVQTPPDRTMGGCSLTPALSDGNWELVWSATMGWAAAAYAQTDPTYAAELLAAWRLACAPADVEPSPANPLAPLLFLNNATKIIPRLPPTRRASRLLTGYAVLQPDDTVPGAGAGAPYFIMSTSTQRQTEGHEHPDRGSISLYHEGTPIVLDPGDGWCGYNWFKAVNATFDNGNRVTNGAWYRGSESHSLVSFANATWIPRGGYKHEWGLRGPAWVDRSLFSQAVAYVDLNITRAVQISQLPAVRGYHRHVFANWPDGTYLLWDAVNAPQDDCAQATYNLHVVTQLGQDNVGGEATTTPANSRCTISTSSSSSSTPSSPSTSEANTENDNLTTTLLSCAALNNISMDVMVVRPSQAISRSLLRVRADPLPVQFTGMTGVPDGEPGGALAGDWNTPDNLAPRQGVAGATSPAHWLPRSATWIELQAGERPKTTSPGSSPKSDQLGPKFETETETATTTTLPPPPPPSTACAGFITLLQPRNTTAPYSRVTRSELLPGGAALVEVTTTKHSLGSGDNVRNGNRTSVYLLGPSVEAGAGAKFSGTAGVVGLVEDRGDKSASAGAKHIGGRNLVLEHLTVVEATSLVLPAHNLSLTSVASGVPISLALRSLARDQYEITIHSSVPAMLSLRLPWGGNWPPREINVWRGSHVWHVANGTAANGVVFEALPGEVYLVERQCQWSARAGYGNGGWLCDPAHD